MTKNKKKSKRPVFVFWDLSFAICWFVSDFDIRISDFATSAPLREKSPLNVRGFTRILLKASSLS
jgi:hypothetical protein